MLNTPNHSNHLNSINSNTNNNHSIMTDSDGEEEFLVTKLWGMRVRK